MRLGLLFFKSVSIPFLILILISTKSLGQTVSLHYKKIPLNEVLLDINDQFDTQISINSNLSTNCEITLKATFISIEQALEKLAEGCDLQLTKISGVYIFKNKKSKEEPTNLIASTSKKAAPVEYLFQGQIVEKESGEPLPFASIQLAGQGLMADESGRFSFKSTNEEEKIQISSLGYFLTDSTFQHGKKLSISLQPKVFELNEVEVEGVNEAANTHLGENAGQLTFNNIENSLVPGISTNLIFNNLRLYPGIMAAGESITDYVIWGSFAGQNHVIYDGITLFNSWGINDDIGRVNPFIIKNVEVYKGGYNVPYGDRIGGVVMIDGKRGHRKEAEGSISLTNQLANIYLNIPMFNNSSALQIAGRKTYFDFLDLTNEETDRREIIVPTYDYSDFNIKFSTVFNNSDRLEISSINTSDGYNGQYKSPRPQLIEDVIINSNQTGNSIHYSKNWNTGGLTSFLASQSYYSPKLTTNFLIARRGEDGIETQELRSDIWTNPIEEYSAKVTHKFSTKSNQQLSISGGYINNSTTFSAGNTENFLVGNQNSLGRFNFHIHDRVQFSKQFSMQLGLKAEMATNSMKVHLQPRVNGKIQLSNQWNVNFGWGIYNQFIARNSVVDEIGNHFDLWQVTDGERVPVLESTHAVIGTSFISKTYEFNIEGYLKNSDGVSRYFLAVGPNRRTRLIQGEARTIGLDILLKKRIQKHEFWLAYTLSEVEELFNRGGFVSQTIYRPAPQDQQHELKSAAIFNFNQLRLSFTQVYGSGFPNTTIELEGRKTEINPYWRTDFSLQYLFDVESLNFQAGISILNIFDQENARLNQSVNVPNGAVVNTLGIPFTPTLYLDCRF